MEEKTKTTVEMTAEEAAEFRAFQEAQARKRAEEKKKADRQTYDELVDAAIEDVPASPEHQRRAQDDQEDGPGQLRDHP